MARSAHGAMPLPPPATVAPLRGAKIVGVEHPVETVTPTAAVLLAELAEDFGPIPPMQLTAVGYGAGTRLTPEPNVLRVLLGESEDGGRGAETLVMLETNVDDMSPELDGYVIERLLGAGAAGCLPHTGPDEERPARGRHQRPVVGDDAPQLRDLLFAETTTLGIRTSEVQRDCLPREVKTVDTPFGPIRIKVARWTEGEKAAPEYEDCRRAAEAFGVPFATGLSGRHACLFRVTMVCFSTIWRPVFGAT